MHHVPSSLYSPNLEARDNSRSQCREDLRPDEPVRRVGLANPEGPSIEARRRFAAAYQGYEPAGLDNVRSEENNGERDQDERC